ncbi:MAG: hypothetical protein OHK0015_33230 [Chloroflexi bacterium OHK40]
MRTTLREKLLLWVVGLSLAANVELLLRSQISPLSAQGLVLLGATVLALALIGRLLLGGGRRP